MIRSILKGPAASIFRVGVRGEMKAMAFFKTLAAVYRIASQKTTVVVWYKFCI
jgi:hypothetical protein